MSGDLPGRRIEIAMSIDISNKRLETVRQRLADEQQKEDIKQAKNGEEMAKEWVFHKATPNQLRRLLDVGSNNGDPSCAMRTVLSEWDWEWLREWEDCSEGEVQLNSPSLAEAFILTAREIGPEVMP